jgi:hypothetical protein
MHESEVPASTLIFKTRPSLPTKKAAGRPLSRSRKQHQSKSAKAQVNAMIATKSAQALAATSPPTLAPFAPLSAPAEDTVLSVSVAEPTPALVVVRSDDSVVCRCEVVAASLLSSEVERANSDASSRVSVANEVSDVGSAVLGAVRMMSKISVLIWESVAVGGLSRVDVSGVDWDVVGGASRGVGEATGVVWEIWAAMAEAVVGDGWGVSAVWAKADIVQIKIERMLQRMLVGCFDLLGWIG